MEDFETDLYDEGFMDDIESFSDADLDDEDDWDEDEDEDAEERQAEYDEQWGEPLDWPSYGE